MLDKRVRYDFKYGTAINCDNVMFIEGVRIDKESVDNYSGTHYIALEHGISFYRNSGSRRVSIIHNESWKLITSFETGQSIKMLMPHIAKLANGFDWTKSYSEIKQLERENFDKYFFGVLSQLRKDCGAWKDIY